MALPKISLKDNFDKQRRNTKLKTLTCVTVCDNQVMPYSDKVDDFVDSDRNEIKISREKKVESRKKIKNIKEAPLIVLIFIMTEKD